MYLQLAEGNDNNLADQCGLPPIKPLRSRSNAPDKWREYDIKRKAWEDCRAGKGKGTSIHPLRAVALEPGRAFFLLLLDYNIDGLASRLATEDQVGLRNQWNKLGGNFNSLVKFINKGKGKTPRRIGFLPKFTGPSALAEDTPTDENPNGITPAQKAAIIAATTTLGTFVAGAIPPAAPIALPGGPILGTVIVGILPFIKGSANKSNAAEAIGAALAPLPVPPDDNNAGPGDIKWLDKSNALGFSNKFTLLAAVNIFGLAGAGYAYSKKKKKAAALIIGATAAADAAYYFASKNN